MSQATKHERSIHQKHQHLKLTTRYLTPPHPIDTNTAYNIPWNDLKPIIPATSHQHSQPSTHHISLLSVHSVSKHNQYNMIISTYLELNYNHHQDHIVALINSDRLTKHQNRIF